VFFFLLCFVEADAIAFLSTIRVLIVSAIQNLTPAVEAACSRRAGLSPFKLVSTTFDNQTDFARYLQQEPHREEEVASCVLLADPRNVSQILSDTKFVDVFKSKRLNWMQSTWAGIDSIVHTPLIRDGHLKLTRLADIFGPQMAEFCLGQIISIERSFHEIHVNQSNKRWIQVFSNRKLNNITVGVMGLGIGKEVARAASVGFNMRVTGLCLDKSKHAASSSYFHRLYDYSELPQFLNEVDYLINTLPHTPLTIGLLNGRVLSECQKNQTVFINVGRGSIIDETSLLEALKEGWIRAAVLDVFSVEPLSADSPLWEHPNIIVTPHVSAVSLTSDVAELFAENLETYLNHQTTKQLRGVVDPGKGY